MQKIKNWWNMVWQKKKITIPVLVVILIAAGWLAFSGNGNGQEIVAVTTGTVTEEVTISGKAKAASEVELGFEVSGKVVSVPAAVGQEVRAGDLLVALDRSELLASLAEARANLAAEESSLLNQNGFAVSSTQLESAGASITEAKNNLTDKINDAFVKADDAIHNTADQFYSNAGSSSSVLNVYISDSDLRSKLGVGRYEMELLLDKWQTEINKTNPTLEDVKTNEARLMTVKNYLTDLAAAVNSLVAGNTTEQTTFDAYKASVSTARTNISTAIANLTAAREKYVSATSNLQIEEGDTKGQLAKVDQSRAKVLSVQAQLNKRVIVAPFDGLVTKQDAKVGQIATAGTVLSGVISKGNLEVEAYVPEVHIGKLMVGNTVEITFDAFPGEKFSGQIIMIDPAETIVGGVPNYEIKVVINQTDSRLRSGLTANLLVQTAKKENVIMVPRFALDEKDGKTFVTKLENGQAVLTPIEIGLIGTDGMVEIVSGLASGDKVTVSK